MNNLSVTVNDRMALIGLDRGKSNAINLTMLQELSSLLKSIGEDDAILGVVLHGKERFFSSGLDLIELYDLNEAEIKEFWRTFLDVIARLVSFKKPAIAAISGHSPAGGCVLALCCDYRIMAEGDFIIGLNEIPVGLIVPDSIFHLYSFWIGQANAYRFLLEGKLMNPPEALGAGLVDEVVPSEKLRSRAENQLKVYMQHDANTWQQSKLNMRRELIGQMNHIPEEMINEIVKQWWAPSTRSILKTIIENLSQKKTHANESRTTS
jgi:3,2-trans-enoyl-CoA isomerase